MKDLWKWQQQVKMTCNKYTFLRPRELAVKNQYLFPLRGWYSENFQMQLQKGFDNIMSAVAWDFAAGINVYAKEF